jgi:hypothetical protein
VKNVRFAAIHPRPIFTVPVTIHSGFYSPSPNRIGEIFLSEPGGQTMQQSLVRERVNDSETIHRQEAGTPDLQISLGFWNRSQSDWSNESPAVVDHCIEGYTYLCDKDLSGIQSLSLNPECPLNHMAELL